VTALAVPNDDELRREGDRIVQLIEDLGAMAGAPVRQRAEELAQRLVHLYGTGLERVMTIWMDTGLGPEARERLRADPLVSSLLVLHGIHPVNEAANEYDPGPDPAAAGAPVQDQRATQGLVQIDLRRGRGQPAGGEP
jgi:hypothetical protein